MKQIKHIVSLALLIPFLFSSCENGNTADDAHERLRVSKTQMIAAKTGNSETGNTLRLEVLSNRKFKIESDVDWIRTDKTEGLGILPIVVKADENTTGAERTGKLLFKSGELTETVTVIQTINPESDDRLELNHVYMTEDFEWLRVFGKDDQVANPATSSTLPLKDAPAKPARDRFLKEGYADANLKGSCFYLARHYIKMGKNNNQTGLSINLKQVEPGKSTNMILSFDVAPHYNAGATSVDKTEITVEIVGSGTVGSYTSKIGPTMKIDQVTGIGQWQRMEVKLYEVRPTTTVIIRSTQFPKDDVNVSGYFRWYLDNIKMEKAPLE